MRTVMKRQWITAFIVGSGFVLSAMLVLAPASAQTNEVTEELLFSRYAEHVAANDAAAEEWHATSNSPSPPPNGGCDEATLPWRRDRISSFCARLCESDIDCGPEEGRCRIVDPSNLVKVAEMPFIDELPVEELPVWMDGSDPRAPPVAVCDPFWEAEGATDADLLPL